MNSSELIATINKVVKHQPTFRDSRYHGMRYKWMVKNFYDPAMIQFMQDIVKENVQGTKITLGTSTYKKFKCSKADFYKNCIIVRLFKC